MPIVSESLPYSDTACLFLFQRRRQQRGSMESWRLALFIIAVAVVAIALSLEAVRTPSYSETQSRTTTTTQTTNTKPPPPSSLPTAPVVAPQSVPAPTAAPTGLPDMLVIGTGGTKRNTVQSMVQSTARVAALQNPTPNPQGRTFFDDNKFLIQGEVQIVEAKSVRPVVICCLREQGRAIRLAGVDGNSWKQYLVDDFISQAIAYAQQHSQGKMLFEVVSKDYDAFGNLFGYLYIPYEGGVWWHPSYQERFYQVNLQLVRRGYAQYMPNQDYLYKQLFKEAEQDAQKQFLGMWQ